MKPLSFTVLLLAGILLFFACKKEKPEPASPQITHTTGTDSIPADTLVVPGDSCYGEFVSCRYFTLLANNTLQPSATNRPVAMFESNPFLYTSWPTNGIDIDSITCNGINMYYDFNGRSYFVDQAFMGNLTPPLSWHVKGDMFIQGFDYTATGTYPFFGGYLALPDTLNIHQPFQMTLTGLMGQSYVTVIVRDYALHEIRKVYRSDSSQVTISFSQSELSQMDPQSSAVFGVVLKKDDRQSFHGKQFNFSRGMSVTTMIDLR